MIIAKPPVPSIGPIDIWPLYPRFVISGTMSDPIIAVFAMVDPDRVAKIVPPATVM